MSPTNVQTGSTKRLNSARSSNPGTLGKPLYLHIKEFVRGKVGTGAWPPGHRVPSENELVAKFGVSRMTANRALRELQQEGVLARRAGVGTFVREVPRQTSLIDIRNIADEIAARGNRHHARVVTMETVTADPSSHNEVLSDKADASLAQLFETPESLELHHVVLVHYERRGRSKGVPVQLEDRLVNAELVPGFLDQDFRDTTPTAFLLQQLDPEELEHTVTAIMPTKQQQELLEVSPREPCLELERRSWSRGKVVTHARLVYPATRYALYGRHRP